MTSVSGMPPEKENGPDKPTTPPEKETGPDKPTTPPVGGDKVQDSRTPTDKSAGSTPAGSSAVPYLDFMEEQIKIRPLNKIKLLRRTVLTVVMALLFGIIACVTLVVLEPLLNNRLHPAEEPEPIILPPETVEVLPKDLPLDDAELMQDNNSPQNSNEGSGAQDNAAGNSHSPVDMTGIGEAGISGEILQDDTKDPLYGYSESYIALQAMTDKISQGLVEITTVTSDDNWLEGSIESQGRSTGAVVADSKNYIMILARTFDVEEAESITVTFHNGTVAPATIRMSDPVTGITVLSASKQGLDDYALDSIGLAELGNSNSSSLRGGPVIALGSPMGINDSICYGIITSTGTPIQTVDSRYRLIMTDIYGSQQASGFLANIQGQIIGVINQNYNDKDVKNMISAIGISELRRTIERLSNNRHAAYLGLTTADVTTQIHEERGIPMGAYITEVAMDSPALSAGIQSGDVLVAMDDIQLTSQAEYIDALSNYSPEDDVTLTIMRERRGEYQQLTLPATLK